MKQPTWLLKNTLTKQEIEVVRHLRKVDPAMRDDFEKLLVSFIDEEERMMEFCAYHESLEEGRSYMMDCSYLRDYDEVSSLQSVA